MSRSAAARHARPARVGCRTAPTLSPRSDQRASRSAARTDRPWRTISASQPAPAFVVGDGQHRSRVPFGQLAALEHRQDVVGELEQPQPVRDRRLRADPPARDLAKRRARTRPSGARRPAASSIGDSSSRATFSTRPSRSASRSAASRTSAGASRRRPRVLPRQRRSPAISSYPPAERGRKTTGWMIPCTRIDSASPAVASWSKLRRGCRGFGWISSTGTWASSAVGPADQHLEPAAKTAAVGSGTLDKLHRHLPVSLRAGERGS